MMITVHTGSGMSCGWRENHESQSKYKASEYLYICKYGFFPAHLL